MSNMLKKVEHSKRVDILNSAFSQFSQYGFQKTSMADIAQACGISRASLYTYFDNKEDIFRCACVSINEKLLSRMAYWLVHDTADKCSMSLAQKTEKALLARYGRLLEIAQSPHGGEIIDERNRLCGALVQESVKQCRALLRKALKAGDKSGEISLASAGLTALGAAEILQMAAAGLKVDADNADVYCKRLSNFVRVFFAGIQPK